MLMTMTMSTSRGSWKYTHHIHRIASWAREVPDAINLVIASIRGSSVQQSNPVFFAFSKMSSIKVGDY